MKPLTETEVQQMLARASEYEINPYFIGLALSGWMWAVIWFLCWVLSL
jgi:hypothetical protein